MGQIKSLPQAKQLSIKGRTGVESRSLPFPKMNVTILTSSFVFELHCFIVYFQSKPCYPSFVFLEWYFLKPCAYFALRCDEALCALIVL